MSDDNFKELLSELDSLAKDQETMAKAIPAEGDDDAKIAEAAGDEDGDEGEEGEGDNDGDEGKPMAKSLTGTFSDGTEFEALDGTEMIKALTARIETSEASMSKALEGAVSLIKSQNEMLKSLTSHVNKLSGQGRGRKAVVSIAEKPAPAAD